MSQQTILKNPEESKKNQINILFLIVVILLIVLIVYQAVNFYKYSQGQDCSCFGKGFIKCSDSGIERPMWFCYAQSIFLLVVLLVVFYMRAKIKKHKNKRLNP